MKKMAEFHYKINFDSVEYISQWLCLYLKQCALKCEKSLAPGKNVLFDNMHLLNGFKPISKMGGIMQFLLSREITESLRVEAFVKNPETVFRTRE